MPRVVAKSSVEVVVPAGQSILVFCQESVRIYQRTGEDRVLLGTVTSKQQEFGPFASDANIIIESGDYMVMYSIGLSPIMREFIGYKIQRAPVAISESGSIPVSALVTGVISVNAGLLGLTGTLPTGASLDAVSDFRTDDAFDWAVISTGLGAYNLASSAGHTIVGSGSIGSAQSATFRTRKTAVNTFVTMRLT